MRQNKQTHIKTRPNMQKKKKKIDIHRKDWVPFTYLPNLSPFFPFFSCLFLALCGTSYSNVFTVKRPAFRIADNVAYIGLSSSFLPFSASQVDGGMLSGQLISRDCIDPSLYVSCLTIMAIPIIRKHIFRPLRYVKEKTIIRELNN